LTTSSKEKLIRAFNHSQIRKASSTSVLPNGLKVLSVGRKQPISSLSLFVRAGSRYETRQTSGAAHFMKHLAGQNNAFQSGLRLVRNLEHHACNVSVTFGREFISYNISFPNVDGQEPNSLFLSETVKNLCAMVSPLGFEYELDRIRGLVACESNHLSINSKLLETAHFYGFRDQGLGQPLFAQPSFIDGMKSNILQRHFEDNYHPNNMILVGTGVSHETIQQHATEVFSNYSATSTTLFPEVRNKIASDAATPQTGKWSGGQSLQSESGNAEVLFAYPAPQRDSKESFALCILKYHLLSVLGAEVDIQNISYSDAGIFSFHVSAPENQAKKAQETIQNSLKNNISNAEFDIAKLAALNVHNHRLTDVFQLAEHLAKYGRENSNEKINSVSYNDFNNAKEKMIKSSPVVAASGDVRGISLS